MPNCNHDWSYGAPADSKEELLEKIAGAGEKGLWIKDQEMDFANELVIADKIVMCSTCDRSATLA